MSRPVSFWPTSKKLPRVWSERVGPDQATLLAEGDGRACVLRLYLREPLACGRDAAPLRQLVDVLPVPAVLHEAPDHLLLSLMPDRPLVQVLELGSGDAFAMGRSAGQLLARLHQQPVPDADLVQLTDLGSAWSDTLDQSLSGLAGQRLGPTPSAALRALPPPADGPVVLWHGVPTGRPSASEP